MNIEKLLKDSKITWQGSEEELIKDFNNIVELIGSLPEPKNSEEKYTKFAVLDKDEENKEAKKEDILKGDMFKI